MKFYNYSPCQEIQDPACLLHSDALQSTHTSLFCNISPNTNLEFVSFSSGFQNFAFRQIIIFHNAQRIIRFHLITVTIFRKYNFVKPLLGIYNFHQLFSLKKSKTANSKSGISYLRLASQAERWQISRLGVSILQDEYESDNLYNDRRFHSKLLKVLN